MVPVQRRASGIAGLALGVLMVAGPVVGQPFLGHSLADALRMLQDQGLQIVFTSELVRPDMRVLTEPEASEPRRVLDELLTPHGLRAEDGAGGTVVVVRAPGKPEVGGGDGRSPTDADPPEPPPMPFIEDEIVVRPSRFSLLVEELDAPLSLSRSDIENLPHLARDVFRTLTLLPGTTGNDVSAQFQIHGGRRDEVEILLDGQELYEAFHLKEFDNAVSTVASQGLDRVSLSTGAFPASRGDRMSGVLDMRTLSPSGPVQGELGLSLTEAYAMGRGGLGRGGDGDRGGWLASARRGFIDFAGRALGDEDPLFWDLFTKVELQLDERNHLRGHLLGARDELDFLRTITDTSERFDTGYDSTYFWLAHQATLGDAWLVETTASVSEIDRERRGGDAAEDERFEVFDHRDTRVLSLTQDWGWQAGRRHALEWGFIVRRYDTRYDYFNEIERDEVDFNIPQSPEPIPGFQGDFRGEHAGVYVTDRFSPIERLTLELGVRYDRHTLTDDTLLSPRVNLAWRLGDRHVLRASWGHFFQSQRPYELEVADGETRFFRAERSEHWVVGYEGILDLRDRAPVQALKIEAYRRDLRDPRPRYENLFESVSAFPEVEADRIRIAPESGRAQGIEVVLRGALGRASNWWLNYALASATDRIGGMEVDRKIDQRHTFNLHFEHPVGENWRLNLAWRFHTGWPTTRILLVEEEPGAEEPEDPEDSEEPGESGEPEGPEEEPGLGFALGPLYGERLSSYHRLDLRASRTWPLRRGQLTFFIDIQNVYDRRNSSGFDAEIDEDTESLVLSEERWPGILPSVGVRWEF